MNIVTTSRIEMNVAKPEKVIVASKEKLIETLRRMYTIKLFEEKAKELYAQELIGGYSRCC